MVMTDFRSMVMLGNRQTAEAAGVDAVPPADPNHTAHAYPYPTITIRNAGVAAAGAADRAAC